MAKLKLQAPIVVGHSYGGSTALALAQRQDVTLAGVILIGPPAYEWKSISSLYYPLAVPVLGELLAKLVIPFFAESMIREGIKYSFQNKVENIPPGFMDFRLHLWSRPANAVAKAKEMVNLHADLQAITPGIKAIKLPVAIVVGDRDQPKILSGSKKLAQDIPNGKLMELSNVGHYPQIEVPHVVVQALAELSNRYGN